MNGQSHDETENVHIASGTAVSWCRVDDHRIHAGGVLAADIQCFVGKGRSWLEAKFLQKFHKHFFLGAGTTSHFKVLR